MTGEAKILREIEEWSGLPLNVLGQLIGTFIDRREYGQEELEEILKQPLHEILSDIPLHEEVLKANKIFKIWEAAKHVF